MPKNEEQNFALVHKMSAEILKERNLSNMADHLAPD